jgi:hypothetical protein
MCLPDSTVPADMPDCQSTPNTPRERDCPFGSPDPRASPLRTARPTSSAARRREGQIRLEEWAGAARSPATPLAHAIDPPIVGAGAARTGARRRPPVPPAVVACLGRRRRSSATASAPARAGLGNRGRRERRASVRRRVRGRRWGHAFAVRLRLGGAHRRIGLAVQAAQRPRVETREQRVEGGPAGPRLGLGGVALRLAVALGNEGADRTARCKDALAKVGTRAPRRRASPVVAEVRGNLPGTACEGDGEGEGPSGTRAMARTHRRYGGRFPESLEG